MLSKKRNFSVKLIIHNTKKLPIWLSLLNLVILSQIKGNITYKEGSDGRVVVYPWTGWGGLTRKEVMVE